MGKGEGGGVGSCTVSGKYQGTWEVFTWLLCAFPLSLFCCCVIAVNCSTQLVLGMSAAPNSW